MGKEIAFAFEATPSFVELRFPDGTILWVDRAGAEKDIAKTRADHAVLDALAYNNPLAYVLLMLRRPRF